MPLETIKELLLGLFDRGGMLHPRAISPTSSAQASYQMKSKEWAKSAFPSDLPL